MIRSILVGLDGSAHSRAALAAAMELAQWHGARLELATATDQDPSADVELDPEPGMGAGLERGPTPAVDTEPISEAEEDEEAVSLAARSDPHIAAAIEVCRERGLAWIARRMQGLAAERLAQRAPAVDLVAVGRRGASHRRGQMGVGACVRSLLSSPARAVLIAPEDHQDTAGIATVYDGSGPALRALSWAAATARYGELPLRAVLQNARQPNATNARRQVRAYLRPHRLKQTSVAEVADSGALASLLRGLRPGHLVFLGRATPSGLSIARLWGERPELAVISECRGPVVVVS